jgi:hypothetical protein
MILLLAIFWIVIKKKTSINLKITKTHFIYILIVLILYNFSGELSDQICEATRISEMNFLILRNIICIPLQLWLAITGTKKKSEMIAED